MNEAPLSVPPGLHCDPARIRTFCDRWNIVEFSLFGSVLNESFRPDSDVDVLVSFAPGSRHSLFDLVDMEDELRDIFGREVDLVLRKTVERSRNPYRRQSILDSARTIYAA